MIGALISGGASLLGGLFGNNSAEKQNAQNIAMQKEFAQKGVRWKVKDAKAAGIHPLAALGAQTHSFAPLAIGDSLGPAMANAGQDIGRAIDAKRTPQERVDAYSKTVQDLTLKRMGLENMMLASQIAKINQAGHPPPFPGGPQTIDGQPATSVVIGGKIIDPNPNYSDADLITQRYGEPAEYLYSPLVIGADAYRNLTAGKSIEQIYREMQNIKSRRRFDDRFNAR